MRDQERLTRPVVVSLPAEIDIANAEHVGELLRAAFAPGVITDIAGNWFDGLLLQPWRLSVSGGA